MAKKRLDMEASQVKRIEQHDTVAAVDDSINTTVIEREQGENTNKRHGSTDDKFTTLHQNHNPSPTPNSKDVVTPKHDELMDTKDPKKKKYKWKIESNQHYMWSSHSHGGIMKVDFGSAPPPPSAPRSKVREKVYVDDNELSKNTSLKIHQDGRVVKEEDLQEALHEIEQAVTPEQRIAIVQDIKEATRLEQEGTLYREDGSCCILLCKCCCKDIVLSDDEGEDGIPHDKHSAAEEMGYNGTHESPPKQILKSVNSWVTLPIT